MKWRLILGLYALAAFYLLDALNNYTKGAILHWPWPLLGALATTAVVIAVPIGRQRLIEDIRRWPILTSFAVLIAIASWTWAFLLADSMDDPSSALASMFGIAILACIAWGINWKRRYPMAWFVTAAGLLALTNVLIRTHLVGMGY